MLQLVKGHGNPVKGHGNPVKGHGNPVKGHGRLVKGCAHKSKLNNRRVLNCRG